MTLSGPGRNPLKGASAQLSESGLNLMQPPSHLAGFDDRLAAMTFLAHKKLFQTLVTAIRYSRLDLLSSEVCLNLCSKAAADRLGLLIQIAILSSRPALPADLTQT